VHYPGDVVAGLMLGAAVTAAGMPFGLWLLRPVVRWLEHTPGRSQCLAFARLDQSQIVINRMSGRRL
jgi:membrane-associated phospholipid phosphatase